MSPVLIFLALFVGAPLVELYVLIEVGSKIGAVTTLLLSLFTAVLGGLLVRMQGLSVLLRVRETIDRGEVPALELMEGAALMLAGVLLLLPGFITDVFGFMTLLSPLRRASILFFLKRNSVRATSHGSDQVSKYRIIDGQFRRED